MNVNELMRKLGRDTGLSQQELVRIIKSAPFRYKHYQVKKRSGGYRDIFHPTPEMKAIQWWIVKNIVELLPVHDSVFSYRKGYSIRDHAEAHLGSSYFLRLDFSDFFPSIKHADVVNLLAEARRTGTIDLDDAAIGTVARLVCRAPKGERDKLDLLALSIGAPSSPAISNAMLFKLDTRLCESCRSRQVTYTRYADDLYFSTRIPHVLEGIQGDIRAEINALESPRLLINEQKTSNVSRKHRIQVTGVIVTPTQELSVGRSRKRHVKSLVHRFILGELSPEEVGSLKGMIAYISSIEEDFVLRLRRKYGDDHIDRLLRG